MVKPWDTATIGDFLDFKNGLNKGKEFFGYGTPIVNYTDVYRKRGLTKSDVRGKVNLTRDEIHRFDARKNDVFFTRTSETPEEVGMSSVLLDDIDDCVFSGFVLRGRPKNDMFVPEYCKYCFTTEAIRSAIIMGCTYTTRALTNGTQLSAIEIVVPPKPEQEAIAKSLTEIDDLISSLEKLITKKKAIKQGAMQELLTGKRRLPGFSGEWETKKLEDYCSLITKQTGFDYSAYIKPALITRKMPNTFPMIQTINFRGRKFTFETDYYIPQSVAMQFPNIVLNKKCVLFSIVGASVGNVGLYPGSITAFCGGAIGITRFRNEQDAEWVFNYMSSPDGQSQIQYVTKGGAQATVTIADIRNFKIPTPEKDERDAISGILENMDHEIEVLEQKLEKYREVKQGMMQQLLTGKIRLV